MKLPYFLRFTLFLCLLSVSFQRCKKDNAEEVTPEEQINPLGLDLVDPEFEARMALAPDTVISLSDVILDNGISIQDYLDQFDPTFQAGLSTGRLAAPTLDRDFEEDQQFNLFISRMAAIGNFIVERTNFIYPAGAADEPAQNGLAYSYGSKNHTVRVSPTTDACVGFYKIFGLDCSGLIYQLSTRAGLPEVTPPLSFGCINIMDVAKWNVAFENSQFDKLFMKNMGALPLNARKTGDIVFYLNADGKPFHVGWVLYNSNTGKNSIFQSNGYNIPIGECVPNLSKGPALRSVDYTHGAASHRIFRIFKKTSLVNDVDGNTYSTCAIGNQTWMQEDLRTTHYNDGSPITSINDNTAWVLDQNGAMCNYNNTGNTSNLYGKLYNWYTVTDPGGLCPVDWHVATDDDWKSLEATLDMPLDEIDGIDFRGAGQEVGTQLMANYLWEDGGLTLTNINGFSALPGGGRSGFDGVFGARETTGFWWTSTEDPNQQDAWYRELFYNNSGINRNTYTKEHGFAVRCVKD